MSGSSLDGLDIVFAGFQEQGGKWSYEFLEAACYPFGDELKNQLQDAVHLNALDYQLLHTSFGHYIGEKVNHFIKEKKLEYQIALIASHGHTTFHHPEKKMTAQLGDGAAIAATTLLPVVTDLRAMDVALGGQGAPIVPIGEKYLLNEYEYFLNLGGIANISVNQTPYVAFDICPANRVLNLLAQEVGKEYDEDGKMAASGNVHQDLLERLNGFDYYKKSFRKSLANDFGTALIYPTIVAANIPVEDALSTYCEHIAQQIAASIETGIKKSSFKAGGKLLATGGGAFNSFLVEKLKEKLRRLQIEVVVPEAKLVNYKEALIMAFIGVLRWRQEHNVLSSVTGASQDSIGGALWVGQPV